MTEPDLTLKRDVSERILNYSLGVALVALLLIVASMQYVKGSMSPAGLSIRAACALTGVAGIVIMVRMIRARVVVFPSVIVVRGVFGTKTVLRREVVAVKAPYASREEVSPSLVLRSGETVKMYAIGRVIGRQMGPDADMERLVQELATEIGVPVQCMSDSDRYRWGYG